jgi:predicted cupin superfamily sugar epimerase
VLDQQEASERARLLNLEPHPEGGWFRETYRSETRIAGDRAISTAIYYMLAAGHRSALHRIDADELWHHYEGIPLRIHVFDENGYHALLLGSLDDEGASPQHLVKAGAWFGAECAEASGYVLVGCTVAPGFEFEHFELASQAEMLARWPGQADVIRRLT